MSIMRFTVRTRGFSLLELMIVVGIVAILGAIAIPSYRRYVVRANRTDAQRALLDVAARQERVFYSKFKYTDLTGLGAPSTVGNGNYTLSVVASSSSTAYVATATAAGTQRRDDKACQSLTLTNTGAQGSTGTVANDPSCWAR